MKNKDLYINRELSWLKFNERVLEEAEDDTVPLCEQLSFLSIFQSNLEEFYMVRVGTLQDQTLLKEKAKDNKTGMTCIEQIDAVLEETRRLCAKRDSIYAELKEKFKQYGIREMKFSQLNEDEKMCVEEYFNAEIAPLLSPMIVGRKQSFPFMQNGAVYAVVVMESIRGKEKIGIIPCSSNGIERIVSVGKDSGKYMLSEEVILHFADKVFGLYRVKAKSLVKITRNADIDTDLINDEDLNYRDIMTEAVRRRKKLAPVRLEMTRKLDMKVVQVLCMHLGLEHSRVFVSNIPLNMGFISVLRDRLRDKNELFYPRYISGWPDSVNRHGSIINQVLKKDILLHYPYDSIRTFLNLLREAAFDDDVISIKMTLYRLAPNSKVVEALVEAAENGKEVVVLVELKARFDEENNIEWSRTLENAGCQVIYGIDGVKVHSKICQITRKKDGRLEHITQIGTGNYNEKTALLYTDLTLITTGDIIGNEIAALFTQIGVGEVASPQEHILVAPNGLQNRLIKMIDEQIMAAKNGANAYIGVKINSLTDIKLINKLIEASKNGVKIDMVIRGICCLVPGIPGETENIRVVSIVGRYLEHSRIYIFGTDNDKIYIGSADWMTRNTCKRIEVAVPVFDESLKLRLRQIFNVFLKDNVKARIMQPDGTYVKAAGEPAVCAQETFMTED